MQSAILTRMMNNYYTFSRLQTQIQGFLTKISLGSQLSSVVFCQNCVTSWPQKQYYFEMSAESAPQKQYNTNKETKQCPLF